MQVPKGILKSTQDIRENMTGYRYEGGGYIEVPRHVNFDSRVTEENCRSVDTLESASLLTPHLRSSDIEKQPEHVVRALKKFLKGDWELDLEYCEDFLIDKILLEFPVFSLNEDYLKALANIVFMKLDSCQNLIT